MFVIRTRNTDFSDAIENPQDNEICRILDTEDCTVEKYTYKECLEIANKVRLEGLSSEGIWECDFFELLNKQLYIKKGNIYVKGQPYFDVYPKDKYVLFFYNGDVVCRIGSPYKLSKIMVSFVWAEKLGQQGYRVVVRLHMRGSFTSLKANAYLFMYYTVTGSLYIERIKTDSWFGEGFGNEVFLNSMIMPAKSIMVRLQWFNGVVE